MNYEKPSLFVVLRQLVPRRRLQRHEAQRIAELQANRFRELQAVNDDELPEEAIATLPRVILTREPDLPVSAVAQWHNGCWIIALNDREPWTRQRFSLPTSCSTSSTTPPRTGSTQETTGLPARNEPNSSPTTSPAAC